MERKLVIVGLLSLVVLAGCIMPETGTDRGAEGSEEPFVLAFAVQQDQSQFVEDATPLAEALEGAMDREVQIAPVQDYSAAIMSVASGSSTAAFLDGGAAWLAWQQRGLETLAADADLDGSTYYHASAVVRADASFETVADLEGVTSCHTSELGSAGTLMPVGYLVEQGLVEVNEEDGISAIQQAREAFFDDPIVGGGNAGAFQCLSAGHGEVAFVRDTTWEEHCGVEERPDWCLDEEEYRILERFAKVPSHPVMVSPGLPTDEKALLLYGLLSLNHDEQGQQVLETVLQTPRITHVETVDHLGEYGQLVSNLPGIEDHFAE